jgi:hypothetical protein
MPKSLRLLAFILAASPVALGFSAGFLGGSAIAADADDQAVEEKVAPFIKCINKSDTDLQGTFQNYRRLLEDIKKNPRTSDVAFVGGFEGVDHGSKKSLECAEDLEKIAKETPGIEDLDRFAVVFRKIRPSTWPNGDHRVSVRGFQPRRRLWCQTIGCQAMRHILSIE